MSLFRFQKRVLWREIFGLRQGGSWDGLSSTGRFLGREREKTHFPSPWCCTSATEWKWFFLCLCEQELFSLIWAGEEIVFSSSLFPLFEAHFFASFLSPKMQIFLGNDGRGCLGKKLNLQTTWLIFPIWRNFHSMRKTHICLIRRNHRVSQKNNK